MHYRSIILHLYDRVHLGSHPNRFEVKISIKRVENCVNRPFEYNRRSPAVMSRFHVIYPAGAQRSPAVCIKETVLQRTRAYVEPHNGRAFHLCYFTT
ncbi:MAG: hypothetical protein EA384_11865 [Spirochaetaceae bacterium]|nr:MAG: hypothetical protein EA384_11865 [Spirochaetaceae bacterium]